jgi:hypothetical protein
MYYVSSSGGNDGNDGKSPEKPWKTLAKVQQKTFSPRDTILLKCGDAWNESLALKGNGSAQAPITLASYGSGDRPKLTADGSVLSLTNRSGWTIMGLELVSTREAPGPDNTSMTPALNVVFNGPGSYSDIIIENNIVSGAGWDKDTKGISVGCAYPTGQGETINNIKINNNVVYNVGWVGIVVSGWDSQANSNLSSNNVYTNVQMNGNHIYNVGNLGSFLQCVTNGEYKRNLVHHTGLFQKDSGWGVCGFMTISTDNIDVAFNEIYDIYDACTGYDGAGLDVDWDSYNTRMQYNYCHDNMGPGIVTMACQDTLIANNRVGGNRAVTVASYPSRGQINPLDFTADIDSNRITALIRMEVSENLIFADQEGTAGFGADTQHNGIDWAENIFSENRVILSGGAKMINMGNKAAFNEYSNNRYYSSGAFAGTVENSSYDSFEAWQAAGYDQSGVFQIPETQAPGIVTGASAAIEGQDIRVSWNQAADSQSGIWHYNIHAGPDNSFEALYVNMMGESKTTSFSFPKPKKGGVYYIKIFAEDNNGNISPAAAICSITIP